jgi:hypothetical protein
MPNFGLNLAHTLYALASSTVDLCRSLFAWAQVKKTKAAVKLHTLLDRRSTIPSFIPISDGKLHDRLVLNELIPEPDTVDVMDRGYLNFARPYVLNPCAAYFVIRARSNTRCRRLHPTPSTRP